MTFDLLLAYGFKSVLVLGTAALATAGMGRAAASWRHGVWSAAFAVLWLLPMAEVALPPLGGAPELDVAARIAEPALETVYSLEVVGRGRDAFPWLVSIWLAGAFVLALRLAWQFARAARISQRAVAWGAQGPGVRLCAETPAPFAFGFMRPVVVLPVEARNWGEEKLRVVLLHEWTHLKRHDTRVLLLAQAICAVYWMNPLVWLALRQLRAESERACDDAVLLTGEEAPVYARHLVEIARSVQTNRPVPEGGIAMARVHQMEQRLIALLNPATVRGNVGRAGLAALGTLALAALIPLSAIRAPAQSGAAAPGVAGRVTNQAGEPVRGAVVKVSQDGGARLEAAMTKVDGSFSVAPLVPGGWHVSVTKEGFATVHMDNVRVPPAGLAPLDVRLAPAGAGPDAPAPANSPRTAPDAGMGVPRRISMEATRINGQLISRQAPSYPPDCKAEGVEGPVVLRVVISREGFPLSIEPMNKQADPRLAAAAIEAVQAWRWRPTLLNGNPVEVQVDIDINFRLDP